MKRFIVWIGLVVGIVAGVTYGAINTPLHMAADAVTTLTGSKTSEVLVLASAATALPQTATAPRGRSAIEIFNNGPNTIYCAFSSATAVVAKARPIAAGTAWAVDAKSHIPIYCISATADQVTGAATIVSELVNN